MARTSAPAIALASGAVLFAAVAAAVVFGYPVIAAPPLLIGVAALFAYRRNQMPYRAAARDSSGMWWKFIAAGLGLFALLIVASGVHDDWDWFPWEMLILSVLLGWALIATGVLLGIVNVVRRVSRRPATG